MGGDVQPMIECGFHSAESHEIVCSKDGSWAYGECQERFRGPVTPLHGGIAVLHILGEQGHARCCQRLAISFQCECVAGCLDNHGGALVSQLQKMPCCQFTRIVKVDINNWQGRILFILAWNAEYQRLPMLSAPSRSKHIWHRETPSHHQETVYPTTRKPLQMLPTNRCIFVRITQQELVAVLPGNSLNLFCNLCIEGVGNCE